MRQKTLLAATVLGGTPVLLLDEPMIGLDPLGQRELRALLTALRADGHALLVSTHLLENAAAMCDRMLVLDGGRLVASGTIDELRARRSRPGRLAMWLLYAAAIAGFAFIKTAPQARGAAGAHPAFVLVVNDFWICGFTFVFGIVLASGTSRWLGVFSSRAEALLLPRSAAPSLLVAAYLQLRAVALALAQAFTRFAYLIVFGIPSGTTVHALLAQLCFFAAAAAAIASVALPRALARGTARVAMIAAGCAVAAAATVPLLIEGLRLLRLPETAALLRAAPAVHPGEILVALAAGDLRAILIPLAAALAASAAFAFAARDAYPELYAISRANMDWRMRVRERRDARSASVAAAPGTRPVRSASGTRLRGAFALVWADALMFARNVSPAITAIVALLALSGAGEDAEGQLGIAPREERERDAAAQREQGDDRSYRRRDVAREHERVGPDQRERAAQTRPARAAHRPRARCGGDARAACIAALADAHAPVEVRERDRVELGIRIARGERERSARGQRRRERDQDRAQIACGERDQDLAGMNRRRSAQQRGGLGEPKQAQTLDEERDRRRRRDRAAGRDHRDARGTARVAMIAAGCAVAAAATVPLLIEGLRLLRLPETAALLRAAPAVHPGEILVALAAGDLRAILIPLAAALAASAAFAFAARDAYPELYAISRANMDWRMRVRERRDARSASVAAAPGTRPVRSASGTRLRGAFALVWADALMFARNVSPAITAIVALLALSGGVAFALFARSDPQLAFGIFAGAGPGLAIAVASTTGVRLAPALRMPLFWLGDVRLAARLAGWAAGETRCEAHVAEPEQRHAQRRREAHAGRRRDP